MRASGNFVIALLAVLGPAAAQQTAPHIGYLYPAGGQQGATVEVIAGGQYLDRVSGVLVSGSGVEAAFVSHVKPMTQMQFNQLRDQLQELMKKKAAASGGAKPESSGQPRPVWTASDQQAMEEIRQKLLASVRRPASPSIAEIVTLRVSIAAGAEPGTRELRLVTPLGITNPMTFCIGQLPEISQPPAEVIGDRALFALGPRYRKQPQPDKAPGPMAVTLPATINGQIRPGEVDRFRFAAAKGQKLVAAVAARSLIPYISDAVPGWFQATLALYDSHGKELAYSDDDRFHPDPVLTCEIPADGEYTLEIKDSIYRGREDFVYRISVGELPWISGIFPLGGKAGATTRVELQGWNLPTLKIAPDTGGKAAGIQSVCVRKGDLLSNRMPFAVDTLPEGMEREPNNRPGNAQKVKHPLIINGRIDKPGDEDVYRIQGRAGEEIAAEVMARRLESPLDSVLRLTDSAGKQLALNDDFDDKASGLLTHHADSRLLFRLPHNGTYYLRLSDRQSKGGPHYAYRLRISPPRPDFELRVAPSGISTRAGANVPITVHAIRKDGFCGDIMLRLKDAPRGFALSGAWVPASQNEVRLTLTVPPARLEEPVSLRLEGCAMLQGKPVCRPGVPAENRMQAFAYQHLVPAQDWIVQVLPSPRRTAWRVSAGKPVKLPAGGSAAVKLAASLGRMADIIQLELNAAPDGIAIREVSRQRDGLAILLSADAGKVKQGLKGNLIIDAYVQRDTGAKGAKAQTNRRQPVGTLPAIPFEVVAVR